jgi:LPS-assembly protein
LPKITSKNFWLKTAAPMAVVMGLACATPTQAQIGNLTRADGDLKLAADSPFRDPDIIYLEADTLTNDEATQILTAEGSVEGRYQDRTLRADRVVYNLTTGQVIASGNVVLVQADGSSQYADKLELSNELEAGTATDFVARLPSGAVTAARFVARGKNGEVELYNAYYTACEVCAEKPNPTWRIKARRVTQDDESRTVRYRDATFELFGLPVFYTPFLAHPDPSADRASGILTPFAGYSEATGFNARVPYYWAIDDYTEATITPRVYSKVNPLMEYQFARQFHTGRIEIDGSFTYGSAFDRNGNSFDDASLFRNPDDAPLGKRWRSHFFAKGLFAPSDFWTYGFGLQFTTDDNYLARYSLDEQRQTQGLYEGESLRNTSQAFVIGQNDNTSVTVSTVGFQDLRDRITQRDDGTYSVSTSDDGRLPILAPRIELKHYINDPIIDGRLKASSNVTVLTRETGSDYTRATAGLDYSKTWVAPGGIEVKPFGNIRTDYIAITTDSDITPDVEDPQFSRVLGQGGVDIRYPFIKVGDKVNWTLEPRIQVTQSFGDPKLDEFTVGENNSFVLAEDAGNADLDSALLWQSNKSSGFDFWQEGTRIDVGGSVAASWGSQSSAEVFAGQSFSSGSDGTAIDGLSNVDGGFLLGSGLEGKQSDIVGEATLKLGSLIRSQTRLRYSEDTKDLTRIDTQLNLRTKWVTAGARYFKLNDASRQLVETPGAPPEEISGSVRLRLSDNWSTSFKANHDLDSNRTRSMGLGLRYEDDCTLIELLYSRDDFNNDAVRNQAGFGIRVSLLTLGEFGD